jgi:integrase
MKMRLPKHVQAFTDRHGKARYYFRKAGAKRCTLPGTPYSPEFMTALEAAERDGPQALRDELGAERTLPGTINALSVAFFNSGDFRLLSPSTQGTYRGIIERFRLEHGDKRVGMMQRQHIAHLISAKAGKPAAAHNLLRMLRLLMKFAIIHGWRKDDPTIGLKSPKMRSGGFYTWSESDIAAFEKYHAIGTRPRLALGLLLYTAQRRSDIVRLGRQHMRGGVLSVRQQKTGALVEIPVHRDFRALLDATPADNLTFLVTETGKPFTPPGFGNWFRKVCDEAGLPKECAAHGLRKAASRRLAEAGCTAHEIMAITGHRTLREVTRYTEAADRKQLARSAIKKAIKRTSSVKPKSQV